jgi:hypothetical protein
MSQTDKLMLNISVDSLWKSKVLTCVRLLGFGYGVH